MGIREKYSFIRGIMEIESIPREKKLAALKQTKIELRRMLKRESRNIYWNGKDFDYCWTKEWFDSPFTEEEKQEYIEDNWIRINSPYDCTGKWFTSRIVVCNVNTSFGAKAVAYHFMSLDV